MINLKDKIIIQDNFFKKDILNKIKIDISRLNFTNRYNQHSNTIYQRIYFNVELNFNHFAVQEVIKNLKKHDIEVKNILPFYFLSTKHKEATPHEDSLNNINCLVYLKGKNFLNSGTGFYDKKGEEYELNSHVGFKENRAIIFDSDIYHSSLQFNKDCGPRYIMTNFINFKKYNDRKNS